MAEEKNKKNESANEVDNAEETKQDQPKKPKSKSKKKSRSMAKEKNVNVKVRDVNAKFRVKDLRGKTKLLTHDELENPNIIRLVAPAYRDILKKGKSISERLKNQ